MFYLTRRLLFADPVLAALGLGHHRVLDSALRASAAVEFAARHPDDLLVVTPFDSEINCDVPRGA